MTYQNAYGTLANITPAAPKKGSLCGITLFKWEDVQQWPQAHPATGILTTALQLKPGRSMYILTAHDRDRLYTEAERPGPEGTYTEVTVTARVAGTHAGLAHLLSLMKYHQWGIIITEHTGDQRLLGSANGGARFLRTYTSGDSTEASRINELRFAWQCTNTLPFYTAQAFTLTVGGRPYTVSNITHLASFQVGHPGAPMANGDTLFTHPGLAGRRLLLIADGSAIPVDALDGSFNWSGSPQRRAEKPIPSDTATITGGVFLNEALQFYAYD